MDDIINLYREGKTISMIADKLNMDNSYIESELKNLKEKYRHKRTFTDDFKKIIAERDQNGVSRRKISMELGINANTVKKVCEQFGQNFKGQASSNNAFIYVDVTTDKACPVCHNEKINDVDIDTVYCMKCSNESIFKYDVKEDEEGNPTTILLHALVVNWAYVN